MMAEQRYTTQLQAGLGMVPETLNLLDLWEPGDTSSRLAEKAISSGIFSRTTARRARNLVAEMFAPRFLAGNGVVAKRLKFLVERRIAYESLVQICFLYTARAQAIFHDFVTEVYWSKYSAGATSIGRSDAEQFVYRSLDTGRMQKRWTETTIRRISAYLIGCCVDFGLLAESGRSQREIRRFAIRPDVAIYLAHDLHFSGNSDMAVARHNDWQLFGLEPTEVIGQLKRMTHDGHLLIQASADLIQISWKYRTMEKCLDALTKG